MLRDSLYVRRLVRSLVVVALIISGSTSVGTRLAAAATSATVNGTVTAASTSVAGTDVSVYSPGSTSGAIANTTTAADGSYTVTVPLGTWDFVFTPGSQYVAVTKHNVVVSGDQTLDVVLVQNGVGSVSGRVVDDLGAPLAGVQVGFFDQSLGSYGAATGSDGRFTVYAKNGSYGLQVSSGGLVAGDVPAPSDGWYLNTANQSFTVNGDTNVGDLTLPAPVHLAVTVLDPADKPVAANVYPLSYSAGITPGFGSLLGVPIASGAVYGNRLQTTGADGTIPGYTYWPTPGLTLNVAPISSPQLLPTTTPPINLAQSTSTTVHLPKGTAISGRVVDDLGAPLAGVQVGFFDQSLGSYGAATGSDGRFTVYAKNGSYGLQVSSGGLVVGDVPAPSDGWYLNTANQSFTVNGDTNVGDLMLPAPVHLAVTVLDPADKPVAANVYPLSYSAGITPGFGSLLGVPIASGAVYGNRLQTTGADGTIPGYTYWPTSGLTLNVAPTGPPQLLPTTTPINLAQSTSLTVHLPKGAAISGRVVDDLGAPLAGVQVGFFDQSLGSYGAPTGADGRFTVYAKNGSYGLQVSSGGLVAGDVPAPSDGWYLNTANQSFTVNGDTNVGDLTLPAPVHLAVTVLDPADKPVAANVYPLSYSAGITPGFGSLLGVPIASGAVYGNRLQTTGADGTIPGYTYWPTPGLTLNVAPISSPQLLPTTTPPINLATSADLVVAYQPNGSVSLIAGSADFYTTLESTILNVPAPGVLANDSNPTGLAVQATLAQSPSHGSVTLNADGSFVYTPGSGFFGTDSFTYRVSAQGIQTAPIPVTITVSPPPVPMIAAISPSSGPATGGTVVTITGSHFTSATGVTFGTVAASAFTLVNDTTITATAPPATPSLVDVHVSTQFGTSQSTGPDQYTYNPPPTISALSPAHGPEAGGTAVTITGTGLSGASTVMFGSKPATSFTVNSDTSITATAPPQADGTVDVTITTPTAGTNTPAATDHYTYDEPAPAITRISPSQGPKSGGTTVTITGSDFTGATTVKFGAVAATSFTVVSDTSITATAPPATAVGPVDITVTTSSGTSATGPADRYTYVYPFSDFLAPVISSDYNQVHAGQGIPIQFQIGGDQGLSIIASGFPTVQQISCSSGAPINTATLTDTAGGGGLSYSASTGTYSYVWKTSKAWAGTCQQFDLRLTDGTDHVALFSFK